MMVLRVHGDDMMFRAPLHRAPPPMRAPQINMMKVHIPFTFKLLDTSRSTYAGESIHSIWPIWFDYDYKTVTKQNSDSTELWKNISVT